MVYGIGAAVWIRQMRVVSVLVSWSIILRD